MKQTTSFLQRGTWLLSIAATAALVGCASGPSTYTASVQSYSGMKGIALPNTYRMELLPSQIQNQKSFAYIESAAQQALSQVGLTRASEPSQPPLVVQVDAISVANSRPSFESGYYGPPGVYGWGFGRPWAPGPFSPGPLGGPDMGMNWAVEIPSTVFHRSVNLVIRDAKSQRIVYETSAQYNDLQDYDPQVWTALFQSALNDFPNPPQGVRQVQTTLAPAGTPAAATTSAKP